jgi:CspA family cold shock protein
MRGVIKRLVTDKDTGQSRGFGFIRASDGTEHFLHRSGLERTTKPWEDLREGDAVEFTPIDGPKGPRAIEVRVVAGRA